MLKIEGTNETTTNAAWINAMDSIDAQFKAEAAEANYDHWWHNSMLVLTFIGVLLLWRMWQQSQNRSKANHSLEPTASDDNQQVEPHAAETHQATKPPLLDSQHHHDPLSQSKKQAAPADSSISLHPDSRYMPKS
jgi:hypothetical protein